jgi:localization factor PodJL
MDEDPYLEAPMPAYGQESYDEPYSPPPMLHTAKHEQARSYLQNRSSAARQNERPSRVYAARPAQSAQTQPIQAKVSNLDMAIRQIMDRAHSLDENFSSSRSGTASSSFSAASGPSGDDGILLMLRDEVSNLRHLLEEANFAGANEQTLNEIAALSGRIDNISTIVGEERSDPQVQDALRDIHALLDKPAQDPFINQHFDRILEKLDSLPQANHDEEFERLSQQMDALRSMLTDAPQVQHFSNLEQQVSLLGDRLSSLESNMRENWEREQIAPSAVDHDLQDRLSGMQGLLERLDPNDRLMRLEDQLASLADRLEHGGEDVRGPIDALASQMETLTSLIGQQGQDSQEKSFAALVDRVGELDQRLREGQSAEGRFDHVEQTLARIDDMLARKMGTSDLGAVEGHLAHLAERIDQRPVASGPSAIDAQALASLEAQISGLADRLDAATSNPHDAGHFEALTARLDALAEQFDRSQTRFDAVDRLGADIQRLASEGLGGGQARPMQEGNGFDAEQVAENAAMRALQQLGPLGMPSGDGTFDAVLDGLKDDLHGLRQMVQARESATEQSLGDVTGILNGIVDRLGSLEEQVRKSEQATVTAPSVSAPVQAQASAQAAALSMAPANPTSHHDEEEEAPARKGLGGLLRRKKKKETPEEVSGMQEAQNGGQPLSAQALLAQRAAKASGQRQATPQTPQGQTQAPSSPAGPKIHISGQKARTAAPQAQKQGHAAAQAAAPARPQGPTIIKAGQGPQSGPALGSSSKADFIAAARRAAQAAARESEQTDAERSAGLSLMDRLTGKGKKQAEANAQERIDLSGGDAQMNRKERRAAVAEAARQAKQSKKDALANEVQLAPDEAFDPDLVHEGLEGDESATKTSLFSKIGDTVSRNSRPLLLAAAAVLLAITTLQMVKNPQSSLYALFNSPEANVEQMSQEGISPTGQTIEGETGSNVNDALPKTEGSNEVSLTQPSGSLVPPMDAEDASRTIAFSEPSGAQSSMAGPTIQASQQNSAKLGPRMPEVVADNAPQPIKSGANPGIDLTPTSSINKAPRVAVQSGPVMQPMPAPVGTNAKGTSLDEAHSVAAAAQSAAQMNAMLAPGVSTSPLMQAAEGGDALAQFELGRRLTLGEGVSADMKKAAVWFEKAANQSMPQAQYSLANLYEKGHGVKKDLMVARLWYERAAEAGNVKAMHNLAVLHAEGGLGKPDFKQAAGWFTKAADHGLKDSQYNLAILSARGMGLKRDLISSYKWFSIAAQNGDKDAATKAKEVYRVLTAEQQKEATNIVKSWVPKISKPSANQVASIPDAWKVKAGVPTPKVSNVAKGGLAKPTPAIIRQAQSMLGALGFNAGQPDGQVGPRTRTAIRNFQESAGLPVDGKLTPALMQALAVRVM